MNAATLSTEKARKTLIKLLRQSVYKTSAHTDKWRNHPLRVAQAVKSIIGLDTANPSRHLLDWLEEYLRECPDIPNGKLNMGMVPDAEMATFYRLETAIRQGSREEAFNEFGMFLKMADPEQILEFFLEVSSTVSPDAFLFVWSAYRCQKFTGDKENFRPLLHLCLECLLDVPRIKIDRHDGEVTGDFIRRGYFSGSNSQSEVFSQYRETVNNRFIRQRKIVDNLNHLILSLSEKITHDISFKIPATRENAAKNGSDLKNTSRRIEILRRLNKIPQDQITPELILRYDAGRTMVKWGVLDFEEVEEKLIGLNHSESTK